MYRVALETSFFPKAALLQQAGRSQVIDIAAGLNAIYLGPCQAELGQRRQCFWHDASLPMLAGQHKPHIDNMAPWPGFQHADRLVLVTMQRDDVGKVGALLPGLDAGSYELLRLG